MAELNRDTDWYLRELLSTLSQVKVPSKLSGLSEYVDTAETVAFHRIALAASEYVFDLSKGTLGSNDGGWVYDSQSQGYYSISLSCDAFDPKLLVLVCSRLGDGGAGPPQSVRSRFHLAPPGKFKELELVWPATFAYMVEPLGALVQRLFDETSTYIAEQLLTRLNSAELRVAKELYALLRVVVTDPEMRATIWFATVGPEYGFRLVDDAAGSGALKAIYNGVANDPVSPERIFAQLIQTKLPRQLLLMDLSAKRGLVMDGCIPKAGYAQQGLSYTYVMQSLYQANQFCIFPIFRAESVAVFALFPSELDAVRNLMAENLSRFEEVAARLVTPIVEAAHLFDSELPPGSVPIPRVASDGGNEKRVSFGPDLEGVLGGEGRDNLGLLLFESLSSIKENRKGTAALRRSGTRLT